MPTSRGRCGGGVGSVASSSRQTAGVHFGFAPLGAREASEPAGEVGVHEVGRRSSVPFSQAYAPFRSLEIET